MGLAQEQAQDELRETEPRSSLLLRQEHHPQGTREEVRLSLRVRPRVDAGDVVCRAARPAQG